MALTTSTSVTVTNQIATTTGCLSSGTARSLERCWNAAAAIFRGGRHPNLDVLIADDERIAAVESKLTERPSGGQRAAFKPVYDKGITIAEASPRLFGQADAFVIAACILCPRG